MDLRPTREVVKSYGIQVSPSIQRLTRIILPVSIAASAQPCTRQDDLRSL